MDPLSVLVQALALAGPALQPTADQALKDAYTGLKHLLIERFGAKHQKLERTLDDQAEDPKTYEEPAKKVLSEVGADKDQEVLDEATALLQVAERAQPGISGGLVGQINAAGGRVVVIGGNFTGGTIEMGDRIG